jgi:drug/metabolite transporter (DMT)-like permease
VGLTLFFLGAEAPAVTAPNPGRGNLLAALSGVTWALTICGLRWLGAHGGPETRDGGAAHRAVVAGNALAFLACLPWILPLGAHRAADWTMILYLGVVQIGLAYVCMTGGLRHVPALEASVLLLVEPALNPLWAWLVHGEMPGPWALAGGALILGATLLKTWHDTRMPPPAPVAVAGGTLARSTGSERS